MWSGPGQVCLQNHLTSVMISKVNCWHMTFIVHGQEWMAHIYKLAILFPLGGALMYVFQIWAHRRSLIICLLSAIQWFWLIVENCLYYDEDVTTLNNINHIHNGILASIFLHLAFDNDSVVFSKFVLLSPSPHKYLFSDCHQCLDPKPSS
jgi:hypothetical protein